jgi:hypothetical protein
MKTFEDIWALLAPEGEYKRRRGACERLWQSYDPARQEEIYQRINGKLAHGEYVSENPYFAIEDNAKKPKVRKLVITADEYYRKYGTQDNQEGWQRVFLKEQQRTVYVKQGC